MPLKVKSFFYFYIKQLMFNFIDSLNTIYEIRDEGTKTRYFFVGNNSEFTSATPKSLANYTVKIVNQSITGMDTISTRKNCCFYR